MITDQAIFESYESVKDCIYSFRRAMHRTPEVGWQENITTRSILDILENAGIETKQLNPTGVVANVYPTSETPLSEAANETHIKEHIKALRGDIDALQMQETTNLEYASRIAGVAHACGHDFHAASVLGATLVAQNLRDQLTHPLRFIFQPAEETRPSGAKEAIKQGVLEGVSEIYAIHVEPRLDVGKIGVLEGALTSAADIVTVKLSSSGGHSSRPHLTGDIIAALGAVISNTGLIFSRLFDPRSVVSLTWGSIQAGNTFNAIPNAGFVSGTLRTTDVEAWDKAEQIFNNVVQSIVAPYGVTLEIIYEKGVPPVINTELGAANMRRCTEELFGVQVLRDAERSLGGEDFSWYLRQMAPDGSKIQGGMTRMGAATPGLARNDIHQSNLVVDESILDFAVPYMVKLVID